MGDIKDKHCLILDDIIDTGNTLIKTVNVLKQGGARKVLAYGTHGLFTEGFEKFSPFDSVIIRDTVYQELQEKLEVISMIDLFGEAIYRTFVGESLSSLFNNK
jgi:ribose-phosphate pyrophosphokinase